MPRGSPMLVVDYDPKDLAGYRREWARKFKETTGMSIGTAQEQVA
jgi:hypothetical protein